MIWSRIKKIGLDFTLKYRPEIVANRTYRRFFGKDINWRNPKNQIEKTYWLQLNSDTSLWTLGADKYRVRKYVEEKGYSEILNELYGVWDNAEDIDWENLPNKFVLKTNHGCGQVIIVEDKSKLDHEKTIKSLRKWMDRNYGWESVQFHYTRIKPCVIAEKLLVNKSEPEKSLIDYKIWCFHGEPESILTVFDRKKGGYALSFFDLEWNNISDRTLKKTVSSYSGKNIPKPKSLDKMIEIARALSKDFIQVRVDFYEVDEEPVFGELTFTTAYDYCLEEYYNYLGSKIDLSKV